MTGSHDELLHFNGINAATGGYGLSPMTGEAMARLIAGEAPADNEHDLRARKKRDDGRPEEIARLQQELVDKNSELRTAQAAAVIDPARVEALTREIRALERELARRKHMGVKEGVDPTCLAQAGWGVIFGARANPAIREALQELLDLRAAQAGPRFRIYEGPKGYRPGERKSKFLQRNGAAPSGPADPDAMPYYLLLVGPPEEIPFSFQYQLDVQYAVGRITFPTAEHYAHYARNVVEAETDGLDRLGRSRTMSLFGVRNPDDPATDRSARLLVEPLSTALTPGDHGWDVQTVVGEQASHEALAGLLGGDDAPALLFTASHGAEFPPDDPRQRSHQGALMCSDWPGPKQWTDPIPERFYFAGDHLASDADVAGMMMFCFACYGAGTPQHDEFSRLESRAPREIAPSPFVSALPMALLGRPRGALAVVGHVDRAWGCSFSGGGARAKSHTVTFQSALLRLLSEQPVGHALDYFNARYAELSTELSEELQDEFKQHDPYKLAALWTSNNDARGYVVLGDPAARLTFTGGAARPVASTTRISADSPTPDPPSDSATPVARPPEITEADWERTPLAVQRYIDHLRSR
ncbi:MAG: hypothetical protein AAGF11_22095 [Myxococcota bacterium]